MKQFVRLIAAAVILTLLILMLGPFGSQQAATGISDKLAHVAAFMVIPAALLVLFPRREPWVLCLAALIIGAVVEVVQGQVGRDASWGDLLADAVGVAVAWLAAPRAGPLARWLASDD